MSEEIKLDALQAKSLGPEIVNAAIARRQKELSDSVVRHVEELLRIKAVAKEQIRTAQRQIADADSKIEKLNKGEFSIEYGGQIIYRE